MFFFVFFLSTIFNIFSLTHNEEEVWPDGTHPMLFIVKLCLHAKVLGLWLKKFYLAKV